LKGNNGLFNAEIVAGSLLEKESKIIARLMLEKIDDETWHQRLFLDNLLQKRSQPTIRRQSRLIRNRLETLYPQAWKIITEGSSEAVTQMLLAGAIKHSRLLGDFILKVVKEHIRLFQKQLTPRDWIKFLEECDPIDSQVSHWSESTKRKLGEVTFRILAEAKIIENTRNWKILPFFLNPEVHNLLRKKEETYLLKCLELQ